MYEPILADYRLDDGKWTVEVTCRGKTLRAKAASLVAAKARATRLAERLAPDEDSRTVVHTLDGDAVKFTDALLAATFRPKSDGTGQSG